MKEAHRAALAEVRRVIEPHGFECEFEDHGQKHKTLIVTGRGITMKFGISGSPRSGAHNAADWARQRVIRKLKARGIYI